MNESVKKRNITNNVENTKNRCRTTAQSSHWDTGIKGNNKNEYLYIKPNELSSFGQYYY